MSKFLRLCSCELTKITKKTSTKVMIIILIVSIFAAAGLAAITKKASSYSTDMVETMDYKLILRETIEADKYSIEENKDLDQVTINNFKATIDTYQFALDNDINIYTNFWKSDVINTDMYTEKLNAYNAECMGDTALKEKSETNYNKYAELVKNDDFSGYIVSKRENLKKSFDDKTMSQEEYEDELYVLNLKEKYEIGKVYVKEDSWKSVILSEIASQKQSLQYGVNVVTMKALTEKDYEKINDSIKISEYRLEHNMQPYASGDGTMGSTRKVFDYMVGSLPMMVVAVMIIIIAGGSISSEISKGTIKFWSFTPNKRWKILLSKLLVTTGILIVVTIAMSLIATVVGSIFFGASQDYIYVSNGNVHTINSVLYSIIYNLVAAISVYMFLLLAMMLSTVARNTAASVGISIACYLGGSTISQLINMFVKADWTKFIPFNNLSLNDRIFTGDLSYTMAERTSMLTGNISVKFSIVYLVICATLMIITMFDSFRKRDIV